MTASNLNGPFQIVGLTKQTAKQLMELVRMVSEESGVSASQIWGPTQEQTAVYLRRALWWVFRDGYGMTYVNISKLFRGSNGGHFSYSSVIAGYKRVQEEGKLVFSDQKGRWVTRGSGHACSDVRLREALQIVAKNWNELNPENQLKSWKNSL